MNSKKFLSATLAAAALTVALSGVANAAAPATEKCYGVVKAGKNDCKTAAHSCAGSATKAASGEEFLLVPAGLCAKLNGGSEKPAMQNDDGMMKSDGMNK
ncbi:MAG: DUF2282 domain-containing protein [Micavibrio sp.]|nr:DUF2282 domain-containing protein [Micavibrio sp.]